MAMAKSRSSPRTTSTPRRPRWAPLASNSRWPVTTVATSSVAAASTRPVATCSSTSRRLASPSPSRVRGPTARSDVPCVHQHYPTLSKGIQMKLHHIALAAIAAATFATQAQAVVFNGATTAGGNVVEEYTLGSDLSFDLNLASKAPVTLSFTLESSDFSGDLVTFSAIVRNLTGL